VNRPTDLFDERNLQEPFMSLIAKLINRVGIHHRIHLLAHDVARRCWEPVWARVAEDAATMNDNELRGYVRARALLTVRHEVEAVIFNGQLDAGYQETLEICVLDAIVDAMLLAIRKEPPWRPQWMRQAA
jgi:hypothetical protein